MKKNNKVIFLYLIIGLLGRLIPHPPNFTPITNLCMFSGSKLTKLIAVPLTLILLAVSDVLLAYMYGYPIFSGWTIFSYSGFVAMILLSSKLGNSPGFKKLITYMLAFTLGFWLWTNFGVWLMGYYPKTWVGLMSCYMAALPFLRNAFLGNVVWMAVIWGSFVTIKRYELCKEEHKQ